MSRFVLETRDKNLYHGSEEDPRIGPADPGIDFGLFLFDTGRNDRKKANG
jgi:hypothetical protein